MATDKQKKAFKKSLENNGNISKSMKEAGYSENYSKNPQDLKKSKGWKELMDKYIPDDLLQKVHNEGLKAGRKIYKNNNATKMIEEVGFEPDYSTRHKYLDTAYKVKDKYPATKGELDIKNPVAIVPQALIERFNLEDNGTDTETE